MIFVLRFSGSARSVTLPALPVLQSASMTPALQTDSHESRLLFCQRLPSVCRSAWCGHRQTTYTVTRVHHSVPKADIILSRSRLTFSRTQCGDAYQWQPPKRPGRWKRSDRQACAGWRWPALHAHTRSLGNVHAPILWAHFGCPAHACSQVPKHALDGAACTAYIRSELGRCARTHVLGALWSS